MDLYFIGRIEGNAETLEDAPFVDNTSDADLILARVAPGEDGRTGVDAELNPAQAGDCPAGTMLAILASDTDGESVGVQVQIDLVRKD